jgi:hypothetical protein
MASATDGGVAEHWVRLGVFNDAAEVHKELGKLGGQKGTKEFSVGWHQK